MVIKDNYKVLKCPKCSAVHSPEEWDSATLEICNRECKRQYKSVAFDICRNKASKRVYVCPSCKRFIFGRDIELFI